MKLLASSEEMQIHEIPFCASKLLRGTLFSRYCSYVYIDVAPRIPSQNWAPSGRNGYYLRTAAMESSSAILSCSGAAVMVVWLAV